MPVDALMQICKEEAGENFETKPHIHIYLNKISELYPRGI